MLARIWNRKGVVAHGNMNYIKKQARLLAAAGVDAWVVKEGEPFGTHVKDFE